MPGATLSPTERTRNDVPSVERHRLSRYDLLLAVVPAAFLVGLLAAGLAGVSLRASMGAAAAVGALALVDGLFLNPPREPRARDEGGSA